MSIETIADVDAILSRQLFEAKLAEIYHGRMKKPEWTKERINDIIRILEEYDAALHLRNSTHYYYAKNYDVIEEGGRKCLVHKASKKGNGLDDHQVKIVPVDEYYDVLDMLHRRTCHGGRDKMLSAMKLDVNFIPTSAVVAFVKSCQKCRRGKTAVKKSIHYTSTGIKETCMMDTSNNRGLVKLIDMQSTPDGRYQWILHYQDCTTKFSFLRPLTSNDAAEVASELLKIFLEIGGPAILQIENDRDYTADVIKELADLWSNCKILNGRPYPNPSAELLENVYKQVTAWMQDNSSSNWAKGLYFVQFQKNCTYHLCVQQTPYKALFGCDPKIGMQSNWPTNFLSTISLEEDLERDFTLKSATDIKTKIDNISCVQKVQYANPYSNVYEEVFVPASNNEGSAALPDHSVQIKVKNEAMPDITEIKSEVEDSTTTDEPMKEPLQRAFNMESPSSHKPILCAVCGETTLPTHSCDTCHKIIHDTCGITFFGSSKLLCPTCQKKPTVENDDDDNVKNDLVESPVVIRSEETAPDIKLERQFSVIRNRQGKIIGYNTLKCRCKVSGSRCRGTRCLCQIKNQACTINCHNPLDCHNAV